MKQSFMSPILSAAVFTFALNAHAAEPASGQGMQGKHMECDDKMEDMKGMQGMKMDCDAQKTARSATVSTGIVQEIDLSAKTITLKHGPIKNMKMPAMTMSFGVKDVAMLRKAKVGDQVDFTVESVDNAPTVTMLKKK